MTNQIGSIAAWQVGIFPSWVFPAHPLGHSNCMQIQRPKSGIEVRGQGVNWRSVSRSLVIALPFYSPYFPRGGSVVNLTRTVVCCQVQGWPLPRRVDRLMPLSSSLCCDWLFVFLFSFRLAGVLCNNFLRGSSVDEFCKGEIKRHLIVVLRGFFLLPTVLINYQRADKQWLAVGLRRSKVSGGID